MPVGGIPTGGILGGASGILLTAGGFPIGGIYNSNSCTKYFACHNATISILCAINHSFSLNIA